MPCWAVKEPGARGKISNMDPVSTENFNILFIIDFVYINFDIF